MNNKLDPLLELFEKAVAQFKNVLEQNKNEYTRDAAIKRFEFTFELVWKTLKSFLEKKGLEIKVNTPRDCLREAFQVELIEDNPLWLKTIDYRNLSSHTYNEVLAEELYKVLPSILKLYQNLLKKLKSSNS